MNIIDIVKETYTNDAGHTLYLEMSKSILNKGVVELSFKDSTPTSSSFLNSSFGALIDDIGIDEFKQRVMITDINSVQAFLLKNYVKSYEEVL